MKESRYVLVYLLSGRAKKYHLALTKEVSERFGTENPSKNIAPHLTIKFIGGIKKQEEVNALIKNISQIYSKIKCTPITLEEISNFGKEVIFLNVTKNKALFEQYEKIYNQITKLKFIPVNEKFEAKNIHFHATICAGDIGIKFNDIMQYLSNKHPKYDIKFDNLALMQKKNEKWRVYKKWKLAKS